MELPTKNTFIHFDIASAGGDTGAAGKARGRQLRRVQSDAPAPTSAIPGAPGRVPKAGADGASPDGIAPSPVSSAARGAAGSESPWDDSTVRERSLSSLSDFEPEGGLKLEVLSAGDVSTDLSEVSTPEPSPRARGEAWSAAAAFALPEAFASSQWPTDGRHILPVSASAVMEPYPFAVWPPAEHCFPQFSSGFPAPAVEAQGWTGEISFEFTLRLADDHGLGVDVVEQEHGQAWVVQQVILYGALEAWNQRCLESGTCYKALRRGDLIVKINGATDREGMSKQCHEKFLLKIRAVRPPCAGLHACSPDRPHAPHQCPAARTCLGHAWPGSWPSVGRRFHACKPMDALQ